MRRKREGREDESFFFPCSLSTLIRASTPFFCSSSLLFLFVKKKKKKNLKKKFLPDDPTIMSWNLVNEPRCEGPADCGMQGWIQEMAGAMKKADGNHLVTVGADGFYAAAR